MAVEATSNDVLNATEVPACNEVQCGCAASHSLVAKLSLKTFLDKRNEWHDVFGTGR